MKIKSLDLCGYLDEYFTENPWDFIYDPNIREFVVGFPVPLGDGYSSLVIIRKGCKSAIDSDAFKAESDSFILTVRRMLYHA